MCPFCAAPEPVLENDLGFVLEDRFPVNRGHLLIIPRRHVATYFETTGEEKAALWDLVDRARELVDHRFAPDGYNLGVNIGEAAGQTVMHAHIHLIPRYSGDIANPAGGIRGVIPHRQQY